ncbi:hypothetical protein L873DRAFT_1314701 [Choiromyces venosus 120613-1]|uniref:Uncharacterized protein n=1 Tax=Choiromyces venosus 120613-1 TaxID=1336337 RepID=A0A3N4JB46_9PEZI|nr:hypothetical protein L873DRAFT_1314701 [Choiromyces venosus 120613-1]
MGYFCCDHSHVVKQVFAIVELSLPIDGSQDNHEIFIKGLDTTIFLDALKEWQGGGEEEGADVIEDEDDVNELDSSQDELDGEYLVGEVD